MTISDIPLFQMLKTRMRWHQERQTMLAQNVANAETPGYRARDLRAPDFQTLVRGTEPGVAPAVTNARHIAGPGGAAASFQARRNQGFVTTPDGNAVNLEDEMVKVAQNQLDFQAVTGLYQRSLGLIRTAIGRRGG